MRELINNLNRDNIAYVILSVRRLCNEAGNGNEINRHYLRFIIEKCGNDYNMIFNVYANLLADEKTTFKNIVNITLN